MADMQRFPDQPGSGSTVAFRGNATFFVVNNPGRPNESGPV